jgi:hypothetical protein
MTDYEQGWSDAFDAIVNYVEKEVCIITASMIRRMKDEKWRNLGAKTCPQEEQIDLPSEES